MAVLKMMILCAINMKEGMYVVVTDIPSSSMHAEMEQDMHMLLEGTIAEVIVMLESRLSRKCME